MFHNRCSIVILSALLCSTSIIANENVAWATSLRAARELKKGPKSSKQPKGSKELKATKAPKNHMDEDVRMLKKTPKGENNDSTKAPSTDSPTASRTGSPNKTPSTDSPTKPPTFSTKAPTPGDSMKAPKGGRNPIIVS